MAELGAVASAVFGMGALYWIIAFSAIGAAAYFPKGRRNKGIAATVVLVLFWAMPAKLAVDGVAHTRYARAAWAHFKQLCAEKSGEKIYKTFTGVKSVLVVKPLPRATDRDHFDQYWYGDPYSSSATSVRTEVAATVLAWPNGPINSSERGPGFEFVESIALPPTTKEKKFIKYWFDDGAKDHREELIDLPVSRFGISWEDVSTRNDRDFWVAGSRLSVVDLRDGRVVAERTGYFIESGFGSRAGARRPWLTSRGPKTTCPPVSEFADRQFLMKVLNPTGKDSNG